MVVFIFYYYFFSIETRPTGFAVKRYKAVHRCMSKTEGLMGGREGKKKGRRERKKERLI